MTEALTEAQEVRWSSESMCWRMATPHNHMISKVWVFSPEGNTGWTAFRWCSLMSGSLHYTVITGSYIWVTSPQEQEAWHESIQCLHTSFLQPQSDRQAPDLEKLVWLSSGSIIPEQVGYQWRLPRITVALPGPHSGEKNHKDNNLWNKFLVFWYFQTRLKGKKPHSITIFMCSCSFPS